MTHLKREFPGELFPRILHRTAYRGVEVGGAQSIRFVEAVGINVTPPCNPYFHRPTVRFRQIESANDHAAAVRYCLIESFIEWQLTTGASVDLRWCAWAEKAFRQEVPALFSAGQRGSQAGGVIAPEPARLTRDQQSAS